MAANERSSPRRVARVHCLMGLARTTADQEDLLPARFKTEVAGEMSGLSGRDKLEVVLSLGSSSSSQPADTRRRLETKRLERILCLIYVEIERQKALLDQLLIDAEVLIDGFSQRDRADSAFFTPSSSTLETEDGLFNTLALGGTFDHLHSGHKILLTMAAWLTTHRLIVGITGQSLVSSILPFLPNIYNKERAPLFPLRLTHDELLKNKKHASQLEPIEVRQEAVRGFVERVGPSDLRTETPRLQDVYGPTATDPTIDGLLVSQETLPGAKAIDAIRSQNGLKSLRTYVIDLISNQLTLVPLDQQNLKISSTQIRAWLDSH
ncbi:uncharacterized protein PGTG_15838 [Puccinia graminis f. sp. tritici CRL 75-36-700-3]|uniref:Cytidyltransferase-like domain-containing protein n=1 Tax=Puccinia graminis f. sp. tritici (strain CRL 75-36-700-3 / race SCCL) TaxID=418459 RepID=E3L001_PUCGT|nr:uncharacterized protein PGTG_15838 [Puccinia graminis f. sp. tritici CRL 75-36-700-3]EFP89882.1 hypothetical protein PGTG_15838 [Puccinia graminis f. sp. tritici CRL 75-36-700-3]